MLKTTCLVNNYNYGKFVIDAVERALEQTISFDEVIVVDDFSTDDSVKILQEYYGEHHQVKPILKSKNEGQLSSFNEGYLAATGDIVCFLDSDDKYEPTYLENILKVYEQHPNCDFLFCGYRELHETGIDSYELSSTESEQKTENPIRDLGYSVVSTFCGQTFIGSITSTLSMKKTILDQILPIPYLEDWRIRADDCLVFGSSLVGARKFKLKNKLVQYRIHSNNSFYNKKDRDSREKTISIYKRKLGLKRLITFFEEKTLHTQNNILDSGLAAEEFKTIIKPNYHQFQKYAEIVLFSGLTLPAKIINLARIIKHYRLSLSNK